LSLLDPSDEVIWSSDVPSGVLLPSASEWRWGLTVAGVGGVTCVFCPKNGLLAGVGFVTKGGRVGPSPPPPEPPPV
jgi:hypothetical protein